MTNEEKLKAFNAKVDSLQEETRRLTVTKQQTQSSLDAIETQLQQVLRAHAAGDSKAGIRLDEIEREEKDLGRRLSGTDLLLAEVSANLAGLMQERAPIVAQIQRAEFHRQAARAKEVAETTIAELEAAMLKVAESLCTIRVTTNAVHALCNGNAEGSEYLNPIISRLGDLHLIVGRKIDREGWSRAPHTSVGAPSQVIIQAAMPPLAMAAGKAA